MSQLPAGSKLVEAAPVRAWCVCEARVRGWSAFNDVFAARCARSHQERFVTFAGYDGLARQWKVRRFPVAPR